MTDVSNLVFLLPRIDHGGFAILTHSLEQLDALVAARVLPAHRGGNHGHRPRAAQPDLPTQFIDSRRPKDSSIIKQSPSASFDVFDLVRALILNVTGENDDQANDKLLRRMKHPELVEASLSW